MPDTLTAQEVPETELGDAPSRILFIEQLRADSGMYPAYAERPYNPDIIAKKRPPFAIYDEMRRDDQVKAVLWLKKFMALSSGWKIQSEDDDANEEAVTFIESDLKAIDKPAFSDSLINMLSYLDYGFSISEPVFAVGADNYIHIKSLKTRAPHTFILYSDVYGNLEKIEQYTGQGINSVDPTGLILMTYQPEFGVPYGISDLQAAYRAWFAKDHVIKFWTIYLERFGNPFVAATIPQTLSQTDKNTLVDVLKNLQAKTGIILPEGSTIDVKASQTGTTGFETAIDNFNMMIARSLLVPDLMGLSGGEVKGGSYSLGSNQFEMFFMIVDKIRDDLVTSINRLVVGPLLKWNFGLEGAGIPRFVINPIDTDNKVEMLRLWTEAIKGNIWEPNDEEIEHFRESLKFPSGPVKRPKPMPNPSKPSGLPSKPENDEAEKFGVTVFEKRALTVFEKKINFANIKRSTEDVEQQSTRILIGALRRIKSSMLDTVETSRIVEGKKVDKLADLKVKGLVELRSSIGSMLRTSFDAGWDSAQTDMKGIEKSKKFQVESPADVFEETIKNRSFYITGVIRDEMRKSIGQIILNSIDHGDSVKETIFKISQYFDENWTPQAGEDISKIPGRLETIVRTQTNGAFNQGRRQFFEDPKLDGFVVAYQFSAILDERTSEICEALDGKVYAVGDPYIDQITPPVHYNCRSLLVPIVQGEEYELSKQAVSGDDLDSFEGKIGA